MEIKNVLKKSIKRDLEIQEKYEERQKKGGTEKEKKK